MLGCCVKLGELLSDNSIHNLSSSSLCPFVHLAIVRVPPPTVVSGIVRADVRVVLLEVLVAVGGERRAPPRGILGIPEQPLPPRRPHRRRRRAGPAASTFVLVFVTKFNFHSPPSLYPSSLPYWISLPPQKFLIFCTLSAR